MAVYKWLSSGCVRRLADSAVIPPDPENTDWQAFQDFLAAGGAPDPADIPDDRPDIIEDFKFRREVMNNRLCVLAEFETIIGIQAAAKQFRQDLINIPGLPAVQGAVDGPALRQALVAAVNQALSRANTACPAATTLFNAVPKM